MSSSLGTSAAVHSIGSVEPVRVLKGEHNVFNAEGQWAHQTTYNIYYSYDGDGRRVKASGGASGTRVYIRDTAGRVLEETDQNGNVLNDYFYLGDERMGRVNGQGALYFYYNDHLGTPRLITDGSNVCYDADYFPWGDEQHVYLNTCGQNYKFTGKERDPDMDIDDFGARFYHYDMARFYSPDWSATVEPVPYAKLENPQSLNLYAYVDNNPTTLRDPDGHFEGAPDGNGEEPPGSPGGAGSPQTGAQNNQTDGKAAVIFGETSGLSPALGPDHKPDPDSAQKLNDARENVGDVSDRNSNVYSHTPSSKELKNPQVRQAWEASKDAAKGSDGTKPGNYFFIRQDKVGNQRPRPKAGFGQKGDPVREYGPFRNVGGGDVPKGNNTYVDIYDK